MAGSAVDRRLDGRVAEGFVVAVGDLGPGSSAHQDLRVEHEDVPTDRSGHEVEVHVEELLCRDVGAHLGQHLEPQPEPVGVERLLRAGGIRAPEVVVEDSRELLGRRERHDLAAVLDAAVADEAGQDPRVEALDHLGEVGRVEETRKKAAGRPRHERARGHVNDPPEAGR